MPPSRRKLLGLYYSADQFGQEQARLTAEIESLQADALDDARQSTQMDDLVDKFEQVADLLEQLDLSQSWDNANEIERRTLVDEMLDNVAVYPDRLTVAIHGAPALNVAFSEVDLKDSTLSGVGGGT